MRRLLSLVFLSSCSHAVTARPALLASAPSSSAASSAPASAPANPLEYARAELSKRGPIFGEPIAIEGDPPAWLFFVGEDEAPLSAWVVRDGDFERLDWPEGAKPGAIRQKHDDNGRMVDIDVTSTALEDQPAGIAATLELVVSPHDQYLQLVGSAFDSDPDAVADERPFDEAVNAALDSDAKFVKLIPPTGIAVVNSFHHTFTRTDSIIGTLKDAKELRAELRDRSVLGGMYMYVPPDPDDIWNERDGLVYGKSGDRVVIRAWIRPFVAPPIAATPGSAVTAMTSTAETEETMRELGYVGDVLGQAALARHGTVGLAIAARDRDCDAAKLARALVLERRPPDAPTDADTRLLSDCKSDVMLIVRDGAYTLAQPMVGGTDLAGFRFVDLDGDGVPDVAVTHGDKPGVLFDVTGTPGSAMGAAEAANLATLDATDLDAAIARALALPARGLTNAAACNVVASKHALDKAKLIDGDQPLALKDVDDNAWHAMTSPSCTKNMSCEPTRPVCHLTINIYAGTNAEFLFSFAAKGTPEITLADIEEQ
jgi:hypothetical protein